MAVIAWEGGRILQTEKDKRQHGEWMPWLEANFQMSQPTAWRWMAIAAKYSTVNDLKSQIEMGPKLLRYIELIEEQPREAKSAQSLPAWSNLTMKIDATIPKLSTEEKTKFREWWVSIGERMGFAK